MPTSGRFGNKLPACGAALISIQVSSQIHQGSQVSQTTQRVGYFLIVMANMPPMIIAIAKGESVSSVPSQVMLVVGSKRIGNETLKELAKYDTAGWVEMI